MDISITSDLPLISQALAVLFRECLFLLEFQGGITRQAAAFQWGISIVIRTGFISLDGEWLGSGCRLTVSLADVMGP